MKYSTTIAVDLAKNIFEIAVSDSPGHVRENHRLSRARFDRFFAQHKPATVVFEACSSAHHWARQIQNLGHSVVLLPPHTVRPYIVRNKTDRADAKGILEAFRNKDIHPVPVKSPDQHALAALHRFRSAYLADRTARINTTRGILREFGVTIPSGARHVVPTLKTLVEDRDSVVPKVLHHTLADATTEITQLETRIRDIESTFDVISKNNPVIEQLRSIPGVGLLTATALLAFVGDVSRFPTARHFASFLGLTPREHSSGAHRRLGRISKRGDAYLRMLLIHGARSVICHAKRNKSPDRLRAWALRVETQRGHNKAAVALANKLARIIWAVWRNRENFISVNNEN
jgi:transposase